MSYGRSKILLLGDSLTQLAFEGWGSKLADRYQRRADVLNRGMSGYNTRWYLNYAATADIWDEPGNVKLVTIFFGANDAALPDQGSSRQHVPLPEYRTNLESFVTKAQESYPNAKIIVISPPPVHAPQRLAWQKKRYGEKATGIVERTSDYTAKYADICEEVAKKKNVACMDLFLAMTASADFVDRDIGRFFYDGLHFSATGHTFVYDELITTIATEYPDLDIEPCPVTEQVNNSGSQCTGIPNSGPYHDVIDATHELNSGEN